MRRLLLLSISALVVWFFVACGGRTALFDGDAGASGAGGGGGGAGGTGTGTGGGVGTGGGRGTGGGNGTGGGTAGGGNDKCAHSVCVIGPALTSGCDDCATTVCSVDPYCCENSWDNECVGLASSQPRCGNVCGGGGGGGTPGCSSGAVFGTGGSGGCSIAVEYKCGDGHAYEVQCTCPGASCTCSIDGVPQPFAPSYSGCPSCDLADQTSLANLCNFPH
jgi:hypothetical protein